ncbi:ABC transporter, ATP-binding protein [Candidatus Rhodobacter oscarellae]|uniref:ABC transporter, ATP-binding protein n=1 Tax=Candidatus Rhodobacter oscarellae TaxID=1675527 RepID=A0A0J9GV34_9RHOB|nr:ABC transporter, ATP-binding protein [Candidatus Rhodobacter lobularis]
MPRLEAPAGCALGIHGPSGAGKSTLLFALAGLLGQTKGQVLWGPTDLNRQSERQRSRFRAANIGMIFQDFLLFDELGPVDNAALQTLFAPHARRPGIRRMARDLLTSLGIEQDSRSVASFSGGERQRVAVARALAHDPMIVLADEPTASLHRAAADALTDDLISRVEDRGCSLIVVSHDDRLLDRMDRVISLEHGTVTGGIAA